jgi:metallo-beta-lactamase family protein
VHGEATAQDVLASLIREKLGFDVTIPEYLEEIKIKPGVQLEELKQPQAAPQPVNLDPLLAELKSKIDSINNQMEKIKSLPASRQTEFYDLLKQANQNIDEIKIDHLSDPK